jgi:hypothetical protein
VSDRLGRFRAACGLIGPAAFTSAWLVATRRQPTYSLANEHISGLAAPDAEIPHVMTAGFVAFGVCTVTFASELERRLSHGEHAAGIGPTLMAASGIAMIAAGAFRRDRISNYPMPGEHDDAQSWRNDVHDLSAVAAGGLGLGALIALAGRFRGDPAWRDLAVPALRTAAASAGLSGWFVRDVTRPGNGLIQRASISLPLAFMARVAWRIVRQPSASPGTSATARSTSSAMAATSSSIES